MAINISTDINVTTGGKLTDVGQIQGGWKSVDSASDAYALTGSATTKGLLEDGQIFYVKSSEELLSVSITGNPPFQTYSFSSFSFPGSGGSGDITSVVAGAGLSGGASTGDATLTLDTSSVHFTNAVSASAATAGFGSGGNGGNYDGAISSSVQIANLGAEIISSSGQITSLNNVTLSGTSTIASADINGGTIDGVTIGGTLAGTATFSSVDINGGTLDNVTIGGTLAGTANFSSVNIDGGTIDNTVIGGVIAASGRFTTGNFTNITASASITSSDVYIDGWGSVSESLASVNGGGGSNYDGAISSSAQIAALGAGILSGSISTFPFTGSAIISGGLSVTGSINNIVVGTGNQTDLGSTAIGYRTLDSVTTATNNTAIGANSMFSTTNGGSNVAVGRETLYLNESGTDNVAIGEQSLRNNVSGQHNTAIGKSSLRNSTGGENSALGSSALLSLTDGETNTAIGYQALTSVTTTDGNTAIGHKAGSRRAGDIQLQRPSASIFIGANTWASTNSGVNEIVIGNDVVGNGSNTVTIGNSNITNNYFSGDIDADDITIDGWGSVSASLAALNSGSASGDITGVTAGNGLSGGGLSGGVTLTLDTSSTHFTNAVNDLMGDSGIFTATGSVYSTTNDLEVTGSLTIADGLLKLKEYTTTPSAVAGAIFYSASALYFGVD